MKIGSEEELATAQKTATEALRTRLYFRDQFTGKIRGTKILPGIAATPIFPHSL